MNAAIDWPMDGDGPVGSTAGKADAVKGLWLRGFRNYSTLRLDFAQLYQCPIVLVGPNGAGKTNILEAISLFAPGRGLRGARLSDYCHRDLSSGWSLGGAIDTSYGESDINLALLADKSAGNGQENKRSLRIDGKQASSGRLAELLHIQWLTPQMDRLFLDGTSARRRFLDRLVLAFDPNHATRVNRLEQQFRSRRHLLQSERPDTTWLGVIEQECAELSVAIAAARLATVAQLRQGFLQNGEAFPRAELRVAGLLEDWLQAESALAAESKFVRRLHENRDRDRITDRTSDGPHRSDLAVIHQDIGLGAEQCSTGEQKALLVSILLAHAQAVRHSRGRMPILLLDEVTSHLDIVRREALFDALCALQGQIWLTGTDRENFAGLKGRAQFIAVDAAQLTFEEA